MGSSSPILLQRWHLLHPLWCLAVGLFSFYMDSKSIAVICFLTILQWNSAIKASQDAMAGRTRTLAQIVCSAFTLLCELTFIARLTWFSFATRLILGFALLYAKTLRRAFPSFIMFKQTVRREIVAYFDTVPE